MSLASFFSSTCETRELHADAQLRTRYYRNSFKDVVAAFERIAQEEQYDLRDVNQTHGEIYLLANGFDVIATVSQITPIESGIDFKINYFGFAGFGRPKAKAVALYKKLDSFLKFKGVALHP